MQENCVFGRDNEANSGQLNIQSLMIASQMQGTEMSRWQLPTPTVHSFPLFDWRLPSGRFKSITNDV